MIIYCVCIFQTTPFGTLRFEILRPKQQQLFKINPISGDVNVSDALSAATGDEFEVIYLLPLSLQI